FPFKVLEISNEPLGVGSVAQTHLGNVQLADGHEKEVVFRFIKPGVFHKALEEREVILSATRAIDENTSASKLPFPKLEPLADNVYFMIIEDMDLVKTMSNQMKAISVYSRSDVKVPEVWLSKEQKPLFMIQSKALGMKLSKYELPVRKKVINRIIQFWLEEAIYGSGYFHADLHQGNFLVELRKNFLGAEKEIKYLLDFGMFGKLNQNEKTLIIALGVALKAKNIQAITKIIWDLANKSETKISKEALFKAINEKYSYGSDEVSVEEMLKFFAKINLELKQNVLEFLRGSIALSTQLKEVDTRNTIISNAVKVALKHPLKSLKIFKLRMITFKDLFSLSKKYLFPRANQDKSEVINQCLKYY
ncbi:MAG: hypothetical protein KDD45_14220, partial [Bdellovibrionales bacterium]|nr:hypothetical protein [Bdellovibrionales bacterium]